MCGLVAQFYTSLSGTEWCSTHAIITVALHIKQYELLLLLLLSRIIVIYYIILKLLRWSRKYRRTYETRPLQRWRSGAQHAQTYMVVDDAGTLEVWQDFHGEFLQRGARVARRESSDPPSHDRAFLAHIRLAWCIWMHI